MDENITADVAKLVSKGAKPKPPVKPNITGKEKSIRKDGRYKYLGLPEFVILDVEATGLGKNDEVIEVDIISDKGEKLYHKRFRPSVPISEEVREMTGYSDVKLQKYSAFSEKDLNDIVMAVGNKRVAGHSIMEDARFLRQTLSAHGIRDKRNALNKIFKKSIDTYKIATQWIATNKYGLNNLTRLLGLQINQTHHAYDDCVQTLAFLDRLEDIIRIRQEFSFIKP